MTSAPYTPILLYKPTKISNYQEIYKMRRISGVVLVLGVDAWYLCSHIPDAPLLSYWKVDLTVMEDTRCCYPSELNP
jgi:hypothetical protein